MGDVINAVNESIDATKCSGQGNCNGGERYLTQFVGRPQRTNRDFLNSITLQHLLDKYEGENGGSNSKNKPSVDIADQIEVSIQF